MKKYILFVFIGTMLAISACEPIEKRNGLSPAITEGELDSKISITVDGNNVNCTIDSKDIVYWKTSSGVQSNTNSPQFYFPLANTYQISCTLLGGDEEVTVTNEVTIEQNDAEYYSNPFWNHLTNGPDGKTWVWATDKPGAIIWSVSPWLSTPDIVEGLGSWWGQNFPDLAGQGTSPDDEMYFDLNEGQNYTLTQTGADSKPGSGTGSFDMDLSDENQLPWSDGSGICSYGTITFTNSTIPIASNDGGEYHYVFEILKLTEDELVLAYATGDRDVDGGCWIYHFKRKGYSYK